MLVTLAAPRGINKDIFPWGLELVADFIAANSPDTAISKINLSHDSELDNVFPPYNRVMSQILTQLRPKAQEVFLGNADYISSYTSQVAALGGGFADLIDQYDMLQPRGKKQLLAEAQKLLPKLKTEFDDYLATLIQAETDKAAGGNHIWGITSYDHTTVNVLYLAQMVSRLDPNAKIILGGDYWDYRNSRSVIQQLPWIDGVVVGYGEQILLDIVNKVEAGEKIPEMEIRGLTNLHSIAKEKQPDSIFVKFQDIRKADEGSGTLQTMNVPDDYRSEKPEVPFRLVHRDLNSPDKFRVLTQRGCSFGGCRFCTQIDRMIHFPFSIQEVTRQFRQELEDNPPTGPISISIDNDEMTGPDLLYLIEFFDNLPFELKSVVFWYQVKLFNSKIAAGLKRSKNPSVYRFQMNWESMNPKTLKFMSKGHDPLKAIEAAKSATDAGADFKSNYMCRFPRQDTENIQQEADFLSSAMHLGTGRMIVFSYSANGRDLISDSPERYQIDVTRNPANIWSKHMFGADLDISFWQYDWKPAKDATSKPEYWLAKAYSRVFAAPNGGLRPDAATIWRHVPLAALSLLTGQTAYLKRSWALYNVLKRGKQSQPFQIVGNRLHRDKAILGLTRKMNMKLSDQEIELLRAAYWRIKEAELIEKLAHSMPAEEATALLEKHIKLGTVLRHDSKVISVVSDPEYWSAQLSSADDAVEQAAPQLAGNFA